MKQTQLQTRAETDLNNKIVAITMRIQKEFPELSGYLNEMPVTIPIENNPEITTEILNTYYESLFTFLTSYRQELAEKEAVKKQNL
jgi:hypothetical protein